MVIIGIDIGTTTICGIVVDLKLHKILKTITRPNDSALPSEKAWEKIQDPARIITLVQEIAQELLSATGPVAGIGITGQMHGILYVNENGKAASPLYTWQDGRAALSTKNNQTYASELSQQTGYACAPGFGLATHYYNVQNNLVPKSAQTLCTIGDYAAMTLTSATHPLIDPTNAASLGVFDLSAGAFDAAALVRAGIDPVILPKVVPSGAKLGMTPDSISVFTALGDNQASFLGSVKAIKNSFLINMGTGGQISLFTDAVTKIEGLDTRPFPGKGFLLVGASICGGKSYALLKNFFEKTCTMFGVKAAEVDFYKRMNTIPYDSLPAANQLSVDTQFLGTRLDPHKRGSIANISLENFTPEHLIAGFLEGSAAELHDFYKLIPEPLRQPMTAMTGSGNGIRENKVLRTIFEHKFGFPLRIAPFAEEACCGAAICAAVGSGVYKDFFEAAERFNE